MWAKQAIRLIVKVHEKKLLADKCFSNSNGSGMREVSSCSRKQSMGGAMSKMMREMAS